MPCGSKKRRALRKKELERANDESSAFPPLPHSQDNNSIASDSAAVLNLVDHNADNNLVKVSNKKELPQDMFILSSKENEASKEKQLVNDITSDLFSQNDTENEVLKNNVRIIPLKVANERAVNMEVEETSKFEELINVHEFKNADENEGVVSMEIEESKLKEHVKDDESTKALANERLVAIENEVSQYESVVLDKEMKQVDEAYHLEDGVLAESMAQCVPNEGGDVKENERDQSVGAVITGETSKRIDDQIVNLVASFEAENNYEETGTSFNGRVELYTSLKRLQDISETGLSLSKNMRELFALILDELNDILAS